MRLPALLVVIMIAAITAAVYYALEITYPDVEEAAEDTGPTVEEVFSATASDRRVATAPSPAEQALFAAATRAAEPIVLATAERVAAQAVREALAP